MTDTAGSFMDSLTERQRDVFGLIAIGQDGGHNPRTLAALERRGLIREWRKELAGQPPVMVLRWEVPLPLHIEWARWCAEQPDEKDET